MITELFDAQTALITASSTFFEGEATRLNDEAATLAGVCTGLAGVCAALLLLTTPDDATFDRREATLQTLCTQYEACGAAMIQRRLEDLQFNGVAIDLELVRFYLFGREVAAASKL